MAIIIGFEFGNSCGNISPETWKGDGVLGEIFAHFTPEELEKSGLDLLLMGGIQIEPVQEGEQHG